METEEAKRVKELALGLRDFEPEDLAMFGVGAAVATLAPSPADILYFYIEQWLDDHRNELSPTKYWAYRAVNYHLTGFSYQAGLLAWVLLSHRPVHEKAEWYFSMIAAGATVAVIFDLIKDETEKRKEDKVVSAPSSGSIKDFEAIL